MFARIKNLFPQYSSQMLDPNNRMISFGRFTMFVNYAYGAETKKRGDDLTVISITTPNRSYNATFRHKPAKK